MFIKVALTLLFVGSACASCDFAALQSTCSKHQSEMQKMAGNQQPTKEEMNKMCCYLNEQVSCYKSAADCSESPQLKRVIQPMEGQVQSMCPNYSYEEGCSGGQRNMVSAVTLLASLCLFFRLYQ